MASANATVSGLVQQARTALVHPDAISAYEAVAKVVSLLPSSSESSYNEEEAVFRNKYFVYFAGMLTEYYCSNWLEPDKDGHILDRLFTDTFIRGPPEDSFVVLCQAVSMYKYESSLKLHRIATLLTIVLKDNKCVLTMIENRCLSTSKHVTNGREGSHLGAIQSLLSTIVSLPDIITPKLGSSQLSDFFFPKLYISFLCNEILIFVQRACVLLCESRDFSVSFVSALIAKMSVVGYAEILWDCLLKEFSLSCTKDFLFQSVVQKVMSHIPSQWTEQTIVPMIINKATTARILKAFLGTIAVDNAKLSYVLTHKLLLVRCYCEPRVLQNVIGYLNSSDALKPLLVKSVKTLLLAWADGSSLRHRPLEQSLYICQAILISVAHLKTDSDVVRKVQDAVRQSMLNGLTHYLSSSETQIRQMGCIVAEQLSGLLTSTISGAPQALDFNLVPNEFTQSLRELLIIPDLDHDLMKAQSLDSTLVTEIMPDGFQSNTSELNSGQCVLNQRKSIQTNNGVTDKTVLNKNNASQTSMNEPLDSDDEEDELKPFPTMTSQTRTVNVKRPLYLSQCMEGLLHADDADLVEQCLVHSESLIRSRPESLEIAVEFAQILLHLENRFLLKDFAYARHRTLVATVIASPAQTAQYLAGEFYKQNYNVGQRMDILDTLAAAARELSSASASSVISTSCSEKVQDGTYKSKMTQFAQSQENSHLFVDSNIVSDATPWKEIVRLRIDSKTRRFAAGHTKQLPMAVKNRFVSVAGDFLFPLMRIFNDVHTVRHLDLMGSDHLLLVKLLHTLGVIIYAATNASGITRMAKTLLEFTWSFRVHPQSAVRQSVLYALCMTIVALPSCVLVDQLDTEVTDLKDWLEQEVIERDTDSECRNLGLQTLRLLCSTIREEMEKRVY